jgi:hypothetical protein
LKERNFEFNTERENYFYHSTAPDRHNKEKEGQAKKLEISCLRQLES